MVKRLYYLLLLGLLSCTNQIELEQPDYETKLVVDGYIESNGFANVYLTKSSPFLTEYDSVSIRESFVNFANVTLICSNGDSEQLTLFRKNTFFPPFVYKSVRMKGIVGETYLLKISLEGKIITAITTIPKPPTLLGLQMDSKSDSSCLFKFGIFRDTTPVSYMFLQFKSMLADQNMHPAAVPIYKVDGPNTMLSMVVYRSEETNLYLAEMKIRPYSRWPKTLFSKKDTVLVRVGTVDAVSYQVLKSIFADQSVKDNPFAFNSEGIQTNIVGGIGRWTGIGVAPLMVYP